MKIDIDTLLAFVRYYGGHTVDPVTGDVPSTGFIVPLGGEGNHVRVPVTANIPELKQAAAWVLNQAEQIGGLAHVWTDGSAAVEHGYTEVVFELVELIATEEEAFRLATERDEVVYDVESFTTLAPNRAGE
jgi:hypothetical protein